MVNSSFKSITLDDLAEFKPRARETAKHFLSDPDRQDDGAKILTCAKSVRVYKNASNEVLLDTFYCNHTHCPLCQDRRARRLCSKTHQLLEQNPELLNGNWLYLTFTIRNPHAEDLALTLRDMTKAFQRLSTRNFWKDNVLGGIRFLEITESQDDDYSVHPHFHCLLMVRASMYEGKNYVSTARWTDAWQKALQTYYQPRVHVKRLTGNREEKAREIVTRVGYSTKSRSRILNTGRFLTIAESLRNCNKVQPFGVIRELLSTLTPKSATEAIKELEHLRHCVKPSYHVWDWDNLKYRSKQPDHHAQ